MNNLQQVTDSQPSTTSYTYFRLVTGLIGGIPTSFASKYFDTYEEAAAYFKEEYTDRKKNDEYDAYWNSKPLMVQSVTQIITSFY